MTPIDKQLEELLDLLFFMARDKKCRSYILENHYIGVRKEITRFVKTIKSGRELKPKTYKNIHVIYKRHGTEYWEIRLGAGKITVILNKDNWDQFEIWSKEYMISSPGSASSLMDKYPHVRLGIGYS